MTTGATLQLNSPQQVALTSKPISFSIDRVTSKKANELTDNQWNAYIGMKGDDFPEVPPDGAEQLLRPAWCPCRHVALMLLVLHVIGE